MRKTEALDMGIRNVRLLRGGDRGRAALEVLLLMFPVYAWSSRGIAYAWSILPWLAESAERCSRQIMQSLSYLDITYVADMLQRPRRAEIPAIAPIRPTHRRAPISPRQSKARGSSPATLRGEFELVKRLVAA
jgi:hypothetical protein